MKDEKRNELGMVNETVCQHGDKVHAIADLMAERDESGGLVRVGPRTYCGAEVGLCETQIVPRASTDQTKITCPKCLKEVGQDLGKDILGPKKKKRKGLSRFFRRNRKRRG